MNPAGADPAGAIRVQLITRDGRVDRVRLASSRPTDAAQRLFAGRPVEHLLGTLPMLFSVCATAQASAATQAVEHAGRLAPDPAHVRARDLLVLAETAREHLFRVLLGWPAWLGTAPSAPRLAALGRMRTDWQRALYPALDAFRPGGGRLAPDPAALALLSNDIEVLTEAALGAPPAAWLAGAERWSDRAALRDWARSGPAIAQQMIGEVIERGYAGLGRSSAAGLPPIDEAAWAARLGADDAGRFVGLPDWQGIVYETGALQRVAASAPVAALRATQGNTLLTRLVARLVELAEVVARLRRLTRDIAAAPAGDAGTLADAVGVAQVEAARGRLVHWVRLADGQVQDYRILAPTEWNFHPQGALVQGLQTLPVGADLAQLARLLVDAVDPCVQSYVEVRDDA